jgi:N-acetylglucosaminyl-diphospho-decaprenol L-rhamnosyltransferase
MEPGLAVVVVTYNSARVIDGLLDSIGPALDGRPAEVAVVDNGSVDDTPARVAARGDCLLVPAANDGYGAGLNRGVAALAGSGPVLVANPDVVLAPGAISTMLDALEEDSKVGIVVPRLTEPDGRTARSLRREPTLGRSLGMGDSRWPRLSEIVNEEAAYAEPHDVDWATGAVMLVDRACYDRLRGFDESFFMYSEETDFCLRARDAGWVTRYTPAASAMHVGGDSGRNPELYAMQVLNRVRLHRRRHPWPSAATFLALSAAREGVHALRGDPDSRRALEALVRPDRRPVQLPWSGSVLADSSPESLPVRPARS